MVFDISKKYSKLPKNHAERFRILELKENKIYLLVDSIWSKYTDTYSKPSNEDAYNSLNMTIKLIIKNENFDKEIKGIIEE